MRIEDWKIRKIEKMRREGKKYVDIALETDLSPDTVKYICENLSSYVKKQRDIVENKDKDEVSRKRFRILELEVSEKDYFVFLKIKDELRKKLGKVGDGYVFYILLETYIKYKQLEDENKKIKKMLEGRAC